MNILAVRLGAMGDVIHALPAVAALKRIPGARVTWAVEPRWAVLLEGNPDVDEVLELDRRSWPSIQRAWPRLREMRADLAVDLQGLIKSALVAFVSGADRVVGFDRSQAREAAAAVFYSTRVATRSVHAVDKGLELAAAAGAPDLRPSFRLPAGKAEGMLPPGPFVLASPLAGWKSKQWPLEHYAALAWELDAAGYALVVNGPPEARAELERVGNAHVHLSGVAGLIDATRRAVAVMGVDSGPMHLAAALGKPGIAVFGPTDPARNGPYGGSLKVLRAAGAETTYKRDGEIAASMRAVRPELVFRALCEQLPRKVAAR